MRHRGQMKPKREKWAKHRVHCACGDALQEVLAALRTQRRVNEILAAVTDTLLDSKTKSAVIATLSSRLALESISSDYGLAVDALLAKYATVLHEKGGAPNTQTSLNPGVNKGRRGNRRPEHTTSGSTNLAGPQISMAPEPRRAGQVENQIPNRPDGHEERLVSAEMPTGAIPISHASARPRQISEVIVGPCDPPTKGFTIEPHLRTRITVFGDAVCARCGHEHDGPCPFCECAEHVEPVDPYEVEVERALEDAARNPSL